LSTEKADFVEIALSSDAGVSIPTIGMHDASGLNSGQEKRFQACSRSVESTGQTDPADSFAVLFRRYNNYRFGAQMTATNPFLRSTPITIVNFYSTAQFIAPWTDHSPAKLV
jgi:hypothetical protein